MIEIATLRRVFRPGLVPTVVTLAILPVLVGLGLWQLERADYKRRLHADFDSGNEAALPASHVDDPDTQRFERVFVQGSYDGGRQFLVDNMVRQGRNGYFVLTPLRLYDGRLLLVNRGWIPQDGRRRPLADIAVTGDTLRMQGRVGTLPVAGIDLAGDETAGIDTWPAVVQFPQIDELAEALDEPVEPWVLLLSADAPEGFLREWRPAGLPPSTHIGYAVQWFALATALLVIYVVVNLKKESISGSS